MAQDLIKAFTAKIAEHLKPKSNSANISEILPIYPESDEYDFVSPLQTALQFGNFTLARKLIDSGEDLNHTSFGGARSVIGDAVKVSILILIQGIDTKKSTFDPAIHEKQFTESFEIVAYLLQKGAAPVNSAANANTDSFLKVQETAASIFAKYPHLMENEYFISRILEIITLLEAHGEDRGPGLEDFYGTVPDRSQHRDSLKKILSPNTKFYPLKGIDSSLLGSVSSSENIEQFITIVKNLGIEQVRIYQKDLELLRDPRLSHVKGVSLQLETKECTPLYAMPQLTRLFICEKTETPLDFSHFPNLTYLYAEMPKSYSNISSLTNLETLRMRNYRMSDFSEFSSSVKLQKIKVYGMNAVSLNGLQNMSHLKEIELDKCLKLKTLDGIGAGNSALEILRIYSSRNLKSADAVSLIPNLKEFTLYSGNLDSLSFLDLIPASVSITIYPQDVSVQGKDYYPLVRYCQRCGEFGVLNRWKPLKSYVNNQFIVEIPAETEDSLLKMKEELPFKEWSTRSMAVYSKKNCKKIESIFHTLIDTLAVQRESEESVKLETIRTAVESLNRFSGEASGFIETDERAVLCELIDAIASEAGVETSDDSDGIADRWREW